MVGAMEYWSGKRDSNSRPRPWQGRALPTELFPHDCLRASYLTTRRIIRTPSPGTTLFSHFEPFLVLFAHPLDALVENPPAPCDPTSEFKIKPLK